MFGSYDAILSKMEFCSVNSGVDTINNNNVIGSFTSLKNETMKPPPPLPPNRRAPGDTLVNGAAESPLDTNQQHRVIFCAVCFLLFVSSGQGKF